VAAHSEGGGVEVDGGSTTMTTCGSWTTAHALRPGSRQRCALVPGMRQQRALGLGSRMTGGGGGTMVSRVTEERERARVQKFAKCGGERVQGVKF
jgi:hypothetical protein